MASRELVNYRVAQRPYFRLYSKIQSNWPLRFCDWRVEYPPSPSWGDLFWRPLVVTHDHLANNIVQRGFWSITRTYIGIRYSRAASPSVICLFRPRDGIGGCIKLSKEENCRQCCYGGPRNHRQSLLSFSKTQLRGLHNVFKCFELPRYFST